MTKSEADDPEGCVKGKQDLERWPVWLSGKECCWLSAGASQANQEKQVDLSSGNIKPYKSKSTEEIDGIVAFIIALDRTIRNWSEPAESVYDERGLLVI
ncbi:hypothetical protein KJY78_01025 [Canibacter sp. lx-45]|uniref:hypothetical protein n=1 Tax=Canibacter zhuwentaonis TaxID=2837491 RepID=UPI001BDD6A59|nr:hypothetical protein [Canibacter zhuwentaonis]MBT1034937.1 hypothetical protein [Canibacter zhuwentaonis]